MSAVHPDFQVYDIQNMKVVRHFVNDDFLKGAIELCGRNTQIFLSCFSFAKVNYALL